MTSKREEIRFVRHLILLSLFILVNFSEVNSQISVETAETSLKNVSVAGNCSETFTYSLKSPKSEQNPLVVYFGGGPSSPTIGSDPFPIPPEFGLLRFDYPGVGKNEALVSCGSWTAQRIARIVVRILRSYSPTNYVIYGVSYGTVPATITTALIERDSFVVRPRVLMLESVIGRAYRPGEVIVSFQEQWRQVLKAVPLSVHKKLQETTGEGGCTPESLGAWAEYALSIGAGPGHRHLAEEMLLAFDSNNTVLGFCAPVASPVLTASARKAYQELVCREINSTAPEHVSSFRMLNLGLKPRAGNVCEVSEVAHPYDSAIWQLERTPIAYFIGLRDPATPATHAHYHSANQRATARILLEVTEAGHNPLSVTLADCAEDLFRSYMKSSNSVQQVRLNKCSQKTRFRVIRP